jgi:hypothetical protein
MTNLNTPAPLAPEAALTATVAALQGVLQSIERGDTGTTPSVRRMIAQAIAIGCTTLGDPEGASDAESKQDPPEPKGLSPEDYFAGPRPYRALGGHPRSTLLR